MSLFDEFTEAVDTIRDLQFHATKADNDKSFYLYSNQIFNLTLVGLITLRLFSNGENMGIPSLNL